MARMKSQNTMQAIVAELRAKGHTVDVYTRKDGGIIIKKIDSVKYKDKAGNKAARGIVEKAMTDAQVKQRTKASSNFKMSSGIKKTLETERNSITKTIDDKIKNYNKKIEHINQSKRIKNKKEQISYFNDKINSRKERKNEIIKRYTDIFKDFGKNKKEVLKTVYNAKKALEDNKKGTLKADNVVYSLKTYGVQKTIERFTNTYIRASGLVTNSEITWLCNLWDDIYSRLVVNFPSLATSLSDLIKKLQSLTGIITSDDFMRLKEGWGSNYSVLMNQLEDCNVVSSFLAHIYEILKKY